MIEPRDSVGVALLDVLLTCSLVAIFAAITLPSLHASRDRDAARLAARFIASKLNLLRVEAVRRNRVVAMRFDPDDLGRVGLYIDNDGDGVSQQDIANGVDTPFEPSSHIVDQFSTVALRIPTSVPAPDGNGTIAAESDPVRIGSSNFVSFSPSGTATSGSVYLASAAGTQMCVRIFGATGRIRVLLYDRASNTWRRD